MALNPTSKPIMRSMKLEWVASKMGRWWVTISSSNYWHVCYNPISILQGDQELVVHLICRTKWHKIVTSVLNAFIGFKLVACYHKILCSFFIDNILLAFLAKEYVPYQCSFSLGPTFWIVFTLCCYLIDLVFLRSHVLRNVHQVLHCELWVHSWELFTKFLVLIVG